MEANEGKTAETAVVETAKPEDKALTACRKVCAAKGKTVKKGAFKASDGKSYTTFTRSVWRPVKLENGTWQAVESGRPVLASPAQILSAGVKTSERELVEWQRVKRIIGERLLKAMEVETIAMGIDSTGRPRANIRLASATAHVVSVSGEDVKTRLLKSVKF